MVAVTVQTVDAGARDVNCRVGGPVHGHGQVPLSGGLHAGRTTTQTCSLRHRRSTSTSVVTNAVTTSQVVHLGRTRPGGHCSATPVPVNFDFITRAVQGISGSTLTSLVAERRPHVTLRGRRNMRSLLVVVVNAETVNRA